MDVNKIGSVEQLSAPRLFHSLNSRLILFFLLVSIIPLLGVGLLTFSQSQNALRDEAFNKLVAVRNLKVNQVNTYFNDVNRDIQLVSQLAVVSRSANTLYTSLEVNDLSEIRELGFLGNPDQFDTEAFSYYGAIHREYHALYSEIIQIKDYVDILLVSPEGDIIYSYAKKDDFATNLLQGPYQQTILAQLFRSLLVNGEQGGVQITDYAFYPPNSEAPVSFIGIPIVSQNRLEGFLIYELSIRQLSDLMQDYTGLSQTGETYVVGADGLMRSNSRFFEDNTYLRQIVDTPTVNKGLAGETGYTITSNYRGVSVLSAYQPLVIGEARWALLAEIEETEAFQAVNELRKGMLGFVVLTTLIVVLVGFVVSQRLAQPLIKLTTIATRIAGGQFELKAPLEGPAEVERLAINFNNMTEQLRSLIDSLKHQIVVQEGAEAALRESEGRYRTLAKNFPNGAVILFDHELRYMIAGGSGLAPVGLSPELMEGKTIWEVFPPETCQAIEPDYRMALEGQTLINQLQYGDRIFQTHTLPVKGEQGQVVAGMIMTQDVTERKKAEMTLAEERNLLRTLIDNLPDAIYFKDMDSKFIAANMSVAQMMGAKTTESVIGRSDYDFFPEAIANGYYAKEKLIFQTGQPLLNEEEKVIDASGNQKWFLTTKVPFYDESGQIKGLVGIGRDITETKATQTALNESQQMLLAVLDTIPARVFWKDLNQVYLGCNLAFAKDAGIDSPQKIIGKTDYELVWADQAELYRSDDQIIIESETAKLNYEEPQTGPESEERWLQTSKIPMRDLEGNVIGILGTYEDITARKVAENALRESEENLHITLNSIGDGVISTDTNGNITRMNLIAEALTGWPREEAIGKPLTQVFHIINDLTRNPAENPVEKVLKTGKIIGLANHTVLIAKNGIEYQIADSGAPIRNATGKILGVVLVFRDVTELLRTEQELLKVRKLESVGTLAGGIAHDFNNLLTGLFGNIELAKVLLPTDHKSYKYLESAWRSLESATNLTNQLLTFARGGDPIKKTLSIGEVITETAQFSIRGSNAKLRTDIVSDLWLVEADKGQLSQVISNLVINADQSMPMGGEITIAAENVDIAAGRFVRITVQDTGVGIAPQHLDKIFDPYFTTKQKGSGLGLATTHSIISKHDGRIMVDSHLDRGTVFTIYLPAVAAAPVELDANSNVERHSTISAGRILVMDDEEMVRQVLGAMLTEMGLEVSFSINGQEAINSYRESLANGVPFDVVITDLTIPGGVGGQVVAQEILKINPEAKIIATSGYATDPVMANFKAYGFKGIAVKPYRIADLRELLQQVIAM